MIYERKKRNRYLIKKLVKEKPEHYKEKSEDKEE